MIFDSTANSQIVLSSLKQLKSGIVANDIKCEQGLQLVIKAEDNSPACVKPQAAQKLVERGWGVLNISTTLQSNNSAIFTNSINLTNTDFTLNYSIKGGKLLIVGENIPGELYVIKLQPVTNGVLNITVPEYLVNGKIYIMDNYSKLLNYSESFDYAHEKKTLSISFNKDDDLLTLASESKWKELTNPNPCLGGCGIASH